MPTRNRTTAEAESIDPQTHIGSVHLTVSELSRSLAFYRDVLGLQPLTARADDRVALSATGTTPAHVVLFDEPRAKRRQRGTTGLYHFALLVPNRRELARTIRRLVEHEWPIGGASDHGVSEAIYLSDPEGNGIEVYADRAREAWPYRNGELHMVTEPLDIPGVMSELSEPTTGASTLDPDTRIGHIHLHVSDLERARWFYHTLLGFDVVAYYGRQALFVSAGGYHHHIGLNTWAGAGAPPPPSDTVGLRRFSIVVPTAAEVDRLAARLQAAGTEVENISDITPGISFRDPDEIGIEIRTALQ